MVATATCLCTSQSCTGKKVEFPEMQLQENLTGNLVFQVQDRVEFHDFIRKFCPILYYTVPDFLSNFLVTHFNFFPVLSAHYNVTPV